MYIDLALINDFEERYMSTFMPAIENIIEECGIWYSIEDVKQEFDDPEMTLEDICCLYYFVIKDNTIKFCSPNQLWDDISEYLKGD